MNNPKMQVFATRLKEIRNDNHMTQKEFAQKIGVTPAALSAYENNQKNPSVAVLQRIGENFDVSLTWLCGVAQRKSVNKVFTTYTDILEMFFDILPQKPRKMSTETPSKCGELCFQTPI